MKKVIILELRVGQGMIAFFCLEVVMMTILGKNSAVTVLVSKISKKIER